MRKRLAEDDWILFDEVVIIYSWLWSKELLVISSRPLFEELRAIHRLVSERLAIHSWPLVDKMLAEDIRPLCDEVLAQASWLLRHARRWEWRRCRWTLQE